MSSSREEILNRIKSTIENRNTVELTKPDFEKSVYQPLTDSLIDKFTHELRTIKGEVIICKDESHLAHEISDYLLSNNIDSIFCNNPALKNLVGAAVPFADEDQFINMKACLTGCNYLIARTGSVMIAANPFDGRTNFVFPPVHMVIAKKSQLVFDLEDAISNIDAGSDAELPSLITTITGQSRTADIEKTLILGAHGPKKIVVFLI